jgi:hypothetical protein
MDSRPQPTLLGICAKTGKRRLGFSKRLAPKPRQSLLTCYLRAAQAYMLISIPTGTSTILGVFQVIERPPKASNATSRSHEA